MAAPPGKSAALPTGCYKCGRPGHWSRDCPSSAPSSSPLDPPSSAKAPFSKAPASSSASWKAPKPPKPAVLPRKRPKMTPDLLLSNDGLGYVLEQFPRMVKIQGRGHELEDLGSLLEAYMHWHSRILPYFSFDQFMERVEKVGCTRRVRVCARELRDKIFGGDQWKSAIDAGSSQLREDDPREDHDHTNGRFQMDGLDIEFVDMHHEDTLPEEFQEEVLDEFYRQASKEAQNPLQSKQVYETIADVRDTCIIQCSPELHSTPAKDISEDQRSRMEANRLKALERAKSRSPLVSG